MKTIAMISEHASPLSSEGSVDSCGQNVYVAQLARHLCSRGCRVDVFTRRSDPLLPPIVDICSNMRLIHVPAGPAAPVDKEALLPMMDEFSDYLYRFIGHEERRYDLIHANFFMSGYAALRSAEAFDLPLVMSFHTLGQVHRLHRSGDDHFPPQRIAIETMLAHRATRLIASCAQDRSDLITHYQADPRRIDIVPRGFDPRELPSMTREQARTALGWDPERYTLLYLGRIVPHKGIDNVIRSLALLREQHGIDAQLVVAGGNSETPDPRLTPEIGRLAAIAGTVGVRDHLHFIGRHGRDYLSYLHHAADVFVTTPWYQAFDIAAVEAMACGVPVVGTRGTVSDGVTGRVVPPHDPVALAAALAELGRSPALREKLGRAAQRRVRSAYSWKRVARAMLDVYGRAAHRPATRSSEEQQPMLLGMPALEAVPG